MRWPIYYRTKHTMRGPHENTFDNQNESDPLIEDLAVALAALREELHVRAENAGSIVGPVVLGDDDFRYLTKTYLPRKLKERDWLD